MKPIKHITGKITGIKYTPLIKDDLPLIEIADFNCNDCPSACLLANGKNTFALSKWVSPKRTRSYPFARVYNTLHFTKKITLIPIIKDEGQAGDRDFLQWDTISLMSLLDVFVIFAYYTNAEKKGDKITKQQFDDKYIRRKIKEIESYHSSALHWNLNELRNSLVRIVQTAKSAYQKVEQQTKVKLHSLNGIENFYQRIQNDVGEFMDFSRDKAQKAQNREMQTIQPKEQLSTATKATITIENYLGGKYFFTVDEVSLKNGCLFLIEAKHTKSALLPSEGDIKDGLLKLILYHNLCEVFYGDKKVATKAKLLLTANKLKGEINSDDSAKKITAFLQVNKFSEKQQQFVKLLFNEATANDFIITICGVAK